MSSQRRLERLFASAAASIGVCSVGLCTVACSSGTGAVFGGSDDAGRADGDIVQEAGPPTTFNPGVFSQTVCSGGTLAGVTERDPVDYLELRFAGHPAGVDAGRTTDDVREKAGRPCKTALHPSECADALATLHATGWAGGGMLAGTTYLAYTRRDEVAAVTSRDGLVAFLLPIDTAEDAVLVAGLSGQAIVCDTPNVRPAPSGGYEILTQTGDGCGTQSPIEKHVVHVKADGTVEVVQTVRIKEGTPGCANGRRPEGLVAQAKNSGSSLPQSALAAYFCDMAHLEAASVFAFDRLARELRAHGAPAHLVKAAMRAKADEIRHTKMATRLAAREGGRASAPRVPALPVRGLLAIALENAIEGCVGETFAALLASVQARRSTDPVIARAMSTIARDETRHAALAWDVAEWIEARLADDDRAQVADARRRAGNELRATFALNASEAVQTRAGLPCATKAQTLVDAVRRELWAA